jgi:hypothetical protein
MDAFEQTFGATIALCLGIIILTLFFVGLGYVRRLFEKPDGTVVAVKGFIRTDCLLTVKLATEEIERVKFVGFTKSPPPGPNKSPIPFNFAKLAVFESSDGGRIFLSAEKIQFIKELPNTQS